MSDLLQNLLSAVDEGEKCAALAQQLLNRRIRTRQVFLSQINYNKYKLISPSVILKAI